MKKLGLCMGFFLLLLHRGYAQDNDLLALHKNKTMSEFINRDAARGTRYFFDVNWVRGVVVAANNTLIKNDSFLFNFDKITQNLFLTQDLRTFVEIDKKEFKSVTFFANDSSYVFEHVSLINNTKLFQPLIKNEHGYSLYKLLRTGLKRVYHSGTGLHDAEKNYNQYVDVTEYYIVFPNKEFRSFYNLKKNTIERMFVLTTDEDKVNGYVSTHANYNIDEQYLANLIAYLNQANGLNRQ